MVKESNETTNRKIRSFLCCEFGKIQDGCQEKDLDVYIENQIIFANIL